MPSFSMDEPRDLLDKVPVFGRYNENNTPQTWRQLLTVDPGYVMWVIEECEHRSVSDLLREALQEGLDEVGYSNDSWGGFLSDFDY